MLQVNNKLKINDLLFLIFSFISYIGMYIIHYYSSSTSGMARYVTVVSKRLDNKINVIFSLNVVVICIIVLIFALAIINYNKIKKIKNPIYVLKISTILIYFYSILAFKDLREYYFLIVVAVIPLVLVLINEIIRLFIIKNY